MAYPESLEIAGVPLERWEARRDLAVLRTMAVDEQIKRFIPIPRDEAALESWSVRFAEHWAAHGFGLWAVRPSDGVGAGWVGACHPGWDPRFADRVELAWGVTASLRGRGLVSRAARAAAEGGFDLGLSELLAFVEPENAPSLAVTRRLGMKPAGETHHPGEGVLLQIFTLARGDLPPA